MPCRFARSESASFQFKKRTETGGLVPYDDSLGKTGAGGRAIGTYEVDADAIVVAPQRSRGGWGCDEGAAGRLKHLAFMYECAHKSAGGNEADEDHESAVFQRVGSRRLFGAP
jgi:hypothetical protein